MPDRLGRYATIRDIGEIAPKWAKGCGECDGGILNAKPLPGLTFIVDERIHQMENGEIHFCSCKAGQMYERCLVRARVKLYEMYNQMAKSINGTPT